MHRRMFRSFTLLFVLFSFLLLACDLGLVAASKPTAVIASPPSGSQFREGEDVAVQSTSTDSAGVVRVELSVDGALVRTDPAPSPQVSYALIQTWKATAGSHTITVRAYNAANAASDPAAISITVLSTNATAVPSPIIPTIPPVSPAATSTAAPIPTAASLASPTPTTAAAACVNNSVFVADVTVPDGTVLAAGQPFNKIWRVRNNGTCAWGPGYQYVFVAGEAMAATTTIAVPNTAPGLTADLLIAMVAPTPPGVHFGQWRMKAPNGTLFGNTLNVTINVLGAAPPPPAATATATNIPPPSCPGAPVIAAFTASPGTITAGGSTTLSWGTVTNADSASIDQGIGGIATPGNIVVSPATTTTYTLTASGCGGTVTQQVTVTVTGAPPSASTTLVLQQISINAGGTGQAIANCPSGTKVTGGGFASSSTMVVYSNAMQGNGWEAAAQNTAASSGLLNAYAICASNVSGTVSQVFSQITVGAGTTGQAIKACPSGTVLTGGGYAANSQQQVYSNAMQGNGWESASKNNSGSGQLLNAYALCYTGAGSSSSFVLKQVTVGGSTNGDAKADCPSGTVVTGGGYAGNTNLVVFSTFKDGNGWHSYARNNSGSSQLLNSYAICTHF